jgi:hypothetical protein
VHLDPHPVLIVTEGMRLIADGEIRDLPQVLRSSRSQSSRYRISKRGNGSSLGTTWALCHKSTGSFNALNPG